MRGVDFEAVLADRLLQRVQGPSEVSGAATMRQHGARPKQEFSPVQRKEQQERLAATKADTKVKHARCWEAAAKLAAGIWNRSRTTEDDHPYLQRK